MKLPKFVRAVLAFVDPESSRYALGGVNFFTFNSAPAPGGHQGRHRMQASDGRFACDVSWPTAEGEERIARRPECVNVRDGGVIVDGSVLDKIPAAAWKNDVQLHNDGVIAAGASVVRFAPVEGKFPDLDTVYDNLSEGSWARVTVDAAKLRDICALHVAAHKGSDDLPKVHLWVNASKDTAALFTSSEFAGGGLIRCALMPIAMDKGVQFPKSDAMATDFSTNAAPAEEAVPVPGVKPVIGTRNQASRPQRRPTPAPKPEPAPVAPAEPVAVAVADDGGMGPVCGEF